MADAPIDGQVIVLTAAKASVPPARLPDLLERTAAHLNPQLGRYRREYEQVYGDEHREAFLVEWGHWDEVGATLDLDDREASAVRRAHEEQLLRIGRKRDREAEFETALEIREAVFLPTDEAAGEASP